MLFRALTAFCFTFLVACSTPTAAPGTGQQVIAIGVGSTLELAKLEAIRFALSKSIPQYVVTDRQIIDDEIKKDIVASTMNGFVSDIEILDQFVDESGFVNVTVRVAVSDKRIRDYVARFGADTDTSEGSQVDGSQIANSIERQRAINAAEKRRRDEQWTMAQALATRLFADYPSPATEVSIGDISFKSNDPDTLYIRYDYDLREEWRQSFWQKARAIDQLVTDSGRSNVIEVCPTSRLNFPVMDDRCMRLPGTDDQVKFWSGYTTKKNTLSTHVMLVPIFDKSHAYLGCDQFQIDDGEINGSYRKVRPSRAMIGPISPVFFNGFIDYRHAKKVGMVQGPWDSTNGDYQYVALDGHFFIWGPDPTAFNFMGDDEDSQKIRRTYNSRIFYNDTFNAEYYYPFIAVKKGGKFYRDLAVDKGHGNYELLCREEGLLRHSKRL